MLSYLHTYVRHSSSPEPGLWMTIRGRRNLRPGVGSGRGHPRLWTLFILLKGNQRSVEHPPPGSSEPPQRDTAGVRTTGRIWPLKGRLERGLAHYPSQLDSPWDEGVAKNPRRPARSRVDRSHLPADRSGGFDRLLEHKMFLLGSRVLRNGPRQQSR